MDNEKKIDNPKEKLEYMLQILEQEYEREKSLSKKAQFYLSVATVVFSILVFKIKDIITIEFSTIEIILLIIAVILLGISLLHILLSMKIHDYVRPTPIKVLKEDVYKPLPDFLKRKMSEVIAAVKKNSDINDRRVILLERSLNYLIGSFITGTVFIIIAIILN
jgi:hypothetical protein